MSYWLDGSREWTIDRCDCTVRWVYVIYFIIVRFAISPRCASCIDDFSLPRFLQCLVVHIFLKCPLLTLLTPFSLLILISLISLAYFRNRDYRHLANKKHSRRRRNALLFPGHIHIFPSSPGPWILFLSSMLFFSLFSIPPLLPPFFEHSSEIRNIFSLKQSTIKVKWLSFPLVSSSRHSSRSIPHLLPPSLFLSHSLSLYLSKVKSDPGRSQLREVSHKENKRHWHNGRKIWRRATVEHSAVLVCVSAVRL